MDRVTEGSNFYKYLQHCDCTIKMFGNRLVSIVADDCTPMLTKPSPERCNFPDPRDDEVLLVFPDIHIPVQPQLSYYWHYLHWHRPLKIIPEPAARSAVRGN